MGNIIVINGKRYNANESVVVKSNGVVICDGEVITPESVTTNIKIEVIGSLYKLEVESANKIDVHGDVNFLDVKAGDVTCISVTGKLSTGAGNVNIGSMKNATFE